jgi:hypothetical protein
LSIKNRCERPHFSVKAHREKVRRPRITAAEVDGWLLNPFLIPNFPSQIIALINPNRPTLEAVTMDAISGQVF